MKEEELLRKLDFLKMIYDKSVSPTRRAKEEMEQACQQIKDVIKRFYRVKAIHKTLREINKEK